MSKKSRHTAMIVWAVVVVLIGGIGASSALAMRVANGLAALGCALLFVGALRRGRVAWMVVYGVLTAACIFFVVMVQYSAPVYDIVNDILDEM
jgi:hypothetical protein